MMPRPLIPSIDIENRRFVPGHLVSEKSRPAIGRRLRFALPLLAMALAAATFAAPDVAPAQSVSFQGTGFLPGGTTTQANGLSGDGTTVVGQGDSSAGPREAFSWKAGTITPLASGGAVQSFATGVNSNGTVIVGATQAQAGFALAPVMWTSGALSSLPQNKSSGNVICGSQTYGVNANATGPSSSVVVGQDASGSPGCGPGVPVHWTNGTEVGLPGTASGITQGANASGSVLVGQVAVNLGGTCAPCTQAFSNSTILGDFGGNFSVAYATNADGSVAVGSAAVNNTESRPFRWTSAGGLVALGPAAIFAQALAVNGDGSVVVGQMQNNGPAFRWTATTGFQSIQVLMTANGVDPKTTGGGWANLTQATGISSDGTVITGNGLGPGAANQGWIATLPVTATTQADTHDFNHDGMSDMLWRDSGGNTALWLMNGGAVSSVGVLGQVSPTTYSIIGQRDFNGDGNADILWRDTSGNIAMWFMNGTQVASVAVVGNVPSNWTLYGTGDLNSDGRGDLLWRELGYRRRRRLVHVRQPDREPGDDRYRAEHLEHRQDGRPRRYFLAGHVGEFRHVAGAWDPDHSLSRLRPRAPQLVGRRRR